MSGHRVPAASGESLPRRLSAYPHAAPGAISSAGESIRFTPGRSEVRVLHRPPLPAMADCTANQRGSPSTVWTRESPVEGTDTVVQHVQYTTGCGADERSMSPRRSRHRTGVGCPGPTGGRCPPPVAPCRVSPPGPASTRWRHGGPPRSVRRSASGRRVRPQGGPHGRPAPRLALPRGRRSGRRCESSIAGER